MVYISPAHPETAVVKLSTKSRYGARILMDIAQHQAQGPVQNSEIARRQAISVQYVLQIARLLKKAGFIRTRRGPKGGHLLTKKPEEISLGRVVRVLEPITELVECGCSPEVCDKSTDCRVRLVWMEATEALFDHLETVTVADLAQGTDRSQVRAAAS